MLSTTGSLFRKGTEYDRRNLSVKEKEVPFLLAGREKDRIRSPKTTARDPIAGRVLRGSRKGGSWAKACNPEKNASAARG